MTRTIKAEDLPFGVNGTHEECGCVARRAGTPADDDFLGIFPYVEILVPCEAHAVERRAYERAVEKNKTLSPEYIAGRLGRGRMKGEVVPHISKHGYVVDPVEALGGLA